MPNHKPSDLAAMLGHLFTITKAPQCVHFVAALRAVAELLEMKLAGQRDVTAEEVDAVLDRYDAMFAETLTDEQLERMMLNTDIVH